MSMNAKQGTFAVNTLIVKTLTEASRVHASEDMKGMASCAPKSKVSLYFCTFVLLY